MRLHLDGYKIFSEICKKQPANSMKFSLPAKIFSSPYFFIASAVVLGYWQVAFLKFSLQWDMLDVHLPFLHYLSECLHAGEFPFWNPYQMLGYPFYADLQATPYYLPAIIFAHFSKFNLYILHFYFLMHVFIAGSGMFFLCKNFELPKNISVVAGISYALCGVFISNAQHLLIITAAAYIPFALGQFLRLFQSPDFFNSLAFSLILFLLISGGYPFLTIIFFYLLLFVFLFLAAKMFLEKRKQELLKFSLLAFLSGFIVVLLCLPMIISVKEILPFVSRGNGISLENSLENSYTFRSFLYFLLPFALTENSEFFGTDLSMANIYFGAIAFCFLLYSFFEKKSRTGYFLLFAGIGFLLVSFGQELPFRKILFHYFPGMNYFRFPALFRIFAALLLLIFSATGIKIFLNSEDKNKRKKLLFITGFVSLYFLIHSVVVLLHPELPFGKNVLIQSAVQLILLAVFARVLFLKTEKISSAVFILMVADMFISAQLNINHTVVEPQLNPREIQQVLNQNPEGFPVPQRKNLAASFDERIGAPGIWRNVNVFSKEPSADGFSSFQMNNFIKLTEENSALAKIVLQNPPVFFSSEIFSETELINKIIDRSITPKSLFLNEEDFSKLKSFSFSKSESDTCYFEKFGPNEFIVKTKISGTQILTLMQNNFKGWKAFIDETPTEIFTSNFMFISAVVPAGEHIVKFKFENKIVFTAFLFSQILFVIVLISLLVLKHPRLNSYS